MKNISYEMAAKAIESIYESEIACRIEWMYDEGFIWYLIDGAKFPRILMDGDLEELNKDTVRSKSYSERMKNPIYEKDWIARGYNYSFKETVNELAEKICELYPESKIAQWFTV